MDNIKWAAVGQYEMQWNWGGEVGKVGQVGQVGQVGKVGEVGRPGLN